MNILFNDLYCPLNISCFGFPLFWSLQRDFSTTNLAPCNFFRTQLWTWDFFCLNYIYKSTRQIIFRFCCNLFQVRPCFGWTIFHENSFITDFKRKAELFNSFFAKQCSLINNNSKIPPTIYLKTNKPLSNATFTEHFFRYFIFPWL